MRSDSKKDEPASEHWRNEFGGILRTPRPGRPRLFEFLNANQPTEVTFCEEDETTRIVLTFPFSSRQLPQPSRNAYFTSGLSLSQAFDEAIWNAPARGRNSPWAQLARAGHEAYCAAWMQLLKVVYRDHFGLESDKKQTAWLNKLAFTLEKFHAIGRRYESDDELKSLRRRFLELLEWCRELHEFVEGCNDKRLKPDEIRLNVFRRIYGQRDDHYVLSGKAFAFSQRRRHPTLHNASTWKPKYLAIALLALERGCEYATIQRKIGSRKKQAP